MSHDLVTTHCPIALRLKRRLLSNGMTFLWLDEPEAPVVSMALHYDVGTRHEGPGEHGLAHFVEHMMFRGSEKFPEGEFDRKTEWLGGSNNAFTSYDATLYHSSVGRPDWLEVLAMEADRMRAPLFDPAVVDAEREIILEELHLYDDGPWEQIDRAVRQELFGTHPYGRQILGAAEDLAAVDAQRLMSFHRRHYCPAKATLVVAGVAAGPERVLAEELFAGLSNHSSLGLPGVPVTAQSTLPDVRSTRKLNAPRSRWLPKGHRFRSNLAFRCPGVLHADFAALEVVATLLAAGRTSRLYRRLVDQGSLVSWIDTSLEETVESGLFEIVFESGSREALEQASAVVLGELERLSDGEVEASEIARSVHLCRTDWVFDNLRSSELVVTLADWAGTFGSRSLDAHFGALGEVDESDVQRVVGQYLDPLIAAFQVSSGEQVEGA